MILPYVLAIQLWISIIIYASLEGADFGGGIWDLFAFGQYKDEMRELIKEAVGPVWEANNVWLTYLVVGLFTAFPIAIQLLTTALFIPIALALIGIVLRGSSFVFRTFSKHAAVSEIWSRVFNFSSIFTPFLLGTIAATVASGSLEIKNGRMPVGVLGAWLTPFTLIVGTLGLALCALLASVYLIQEAIGRQKPHLAECFRRRAFFSGGLVAALGGVGLGLSAIEAPILWNGLLSHAIWAIVLTLLLGIALAWSLFIRRFLLARILVILETGAILGTWGLAQFPYIIPPSVTIVGAASPPTTLLQLFWTAFIGMLLLIPALWFLFHVFKGSNIITPVREKKIEEI